MHDKDIIIDVFVAGVGGTAQSNWLGSFRVPNEEERMGSVALANILNGLTYNGNTLEIRFLERRIERP